MVASCWINNNNGSYRRRSRSYRWIYPDASTMACCPRRRQSTYNWMSLPFCLMHCMHIYNNNTIYQALLDVLEIFLLSKQAGLCSSRTNVARRRRCRLQLASRRLDRSLCYNKGPLIKPKSFPINRSTNSTKFRKVLTNITGPGPPFNFFDIPYIPTTPRVYTVRKQSFFLEKPRVQQRLSIRGPRLERTTHPSFTTNIGRWTLSKEKILAPSKLPSLSV